MGFLESSAILAAHSRHSPDTLKLLCCHDRATLLHQINNPLPIITSPSCTIVCAQGIGILSDKVGVPGWGLGFGVLESYEAVAAGVVY